MTFRARLAALAVALFCAAAAHAGTPPDTLVIADKLDDIVSLDPAESFEFSGNDLLNNVYDTLIELDPDDLGPLKPGLAESWSLAGDGVTYTFRIRNGARFHSGNPVTAHDAAWSLRRAILLNKTPAFILKQFGFTAANAADKIRADGEHRLTIITDKPYAPSLFYNCLTAAVASVVDRKQALAHERDGDLGHGWLKTHTAGSGAYHLRLYKPADSYLLEAAPNHWRGAPPLARVFVRHIAEPAAQRLLLERGDVDIARKLSTLDIVGVAAHPQVRVVSEGRGLIIYLSLNQKVAPLNHPKVIQAFKYLVDYDGMVSTFLRDSYEVRQGFVPGGFIGALDWKERPYRLNIAKARALLKEAGVGEFSVRLSVRNEQERLEIAQSLQNTLAQAGITAHLRVATGKEILGEYRARKHQVYLGAWGPDYADPHTNADTFARNPDNRDDARLSGILAWRNAWPATEVSTRTDAAMFEQDIEKRRLLYEESQRIHQRVAPFVPMFQRIEPTAMRVGVKGFSAGGAIHSAFYWKTTK
ncbi:MAG: ABC transporter substrate-binding protein [Gammaproteobacteria bacterium]|nr:ABC transporter substrate-binding protein [Gammaproteobacteria bacterium]